MANSSLRKTLDALASTFAGAVLDAIRGASIQELLAESGGWGSSGRSVRVAKALQGGGGMPDPLRGRPPASKKAKGGRLARRGPAEIAKTLAQVVSLVKGKKNGLRSEEIRKALSLDVREVPRVLKEGLASKKLRSKGQKRATTYFAA